MFPQLIAGPIVKYRDVSDRLHVYKGRCELKQIEDCLLYTSCGGSASSASSSASSAASSGAASQSASSEPTASVSAEENGASDAVASAVDALLKADPISNQFENRYGKTRNHTFVRCRRARPHANASGIF